MTVTVITVGTRSKPPKPAAIQPEDLVPGLFQSKKSSAEADTAHFPFLHSYRTCPLSAAITFQEIAKGGTDQGGILGRPGAAEDRDNHESLLWNQYPCNCMSLVFRASTSQAYNQCNVLSVFNMTRDTLWCKLSCIDSRYSCQSLGRKKYQARFFCGMWFSDAATYWTASSVMNHPQNGNSPCVRLAENHFGIQQVLRVSAVGLGVIYGSWKLSSLKVT